MNVYGADVILFLDIDGVLHPEGQAGSLERRFCCLPAVVQALQDYPNIEIVISSMWRYDFELRALKAMLPQLAERIIGVTPLYEREEGKYLPAVREQEILQWLSVNGRPEADWIAIDDADWQFVNHKHRLVHCDPSEGFCERTAAALRSLLEAVSSTLNGGTHEAERSGRAL